MHIVLPDVDKSIFHRTLNQVMLDAEFWMTHPTDEAGCIVEIEGPVQIV